MYVLCISAVFSDNLQKIGGFLWIKKKKTFSAHFLYIIGLKCIGQLSNHFFHNGIEMHLQRWDSEEKLFATPSTF